MTVSTDLDEFVGDHRRRGRLTGDATELASNGYLLTVTGPCGATFERWVTRPKMRRRIYRSRIYRRGELRTDS
jgi:hypothetical protein